MIMLRSFIFYTSEVRVAITIRDEFELTQVMKRQIRVMRFFKCFIPYSMDRVAGFFLKTNKSICTSE